MPIIRTTLPILRHQTAERDETATLGRVTCSGLSGGSLARSNRRHRFAGDDVFACGDGGGGGGDEKGDELRYFIGSSRAPDRNAAERGHQGTAGAVVVRARLPGELLDEGDRGLGLDPAGRNPDDADALRTHLLREALAVVGERRFRSGISDRRIVKRELPL